MAKTLSGSKFYISNAPVGDADLNQTAFEALTWVEVLNVGSVGETGTTQNMPTYDELGTTVVQKGKGTADAGTFDVEVARNPTDTGQVAMRAACLTKFNYAFKYEKADAPDAQTTNTIHYYRGVIAGPRRPNGRNESFDLELYTIGANQRELTVNPTAI